MSLVSVGQNYQPINSNSLQVFYQEAPYWWVSGANMWGTRVDSVANLNSSDTAYYNYPIYRDTVEQFGGCMTPNLPNWNGVVTKLIEGSTYFFNSNSDSIKINHTASIESSWKAYDYPNGDSIMANIESVWWVEEDWMSDSVKIISFTRYSNGSVVVDPINNETLQLYKTSGVRKAFDFYNFPNDVVELYRVDINSINLNAPGYFEEGHPGKPTSQPVQDDLFYKVTECSGSYLCNFSQHDESKLILSVTSNQSGLITSSVLWNRQTLGNPFLSSTITVEYEEAPDTFQLLHQAGNMPKELGAGYTYLFIEIGEGQEYCSIPVVSATGWDVYHLSTQGNDTCLVPDFAECAQPYAEWFSGKYGYLASEWVVEDGFCNQFADYNYYFTSLRRNGVECGNQFMVNIDENNKTTFNLYPNPATETVQIQLKQQEEVEVIVTDVLGREVYREIPRSTRNDTMQFDVSGWPNGIYLVSVINQKGIRSTQRLVVQH